MRANANRISTLRMVELAVLTALVLVMQLTGTSIRIPFLGTSVNLVLIPIALGAMLLGPSAGAWLGFVCGAVVYILGGVMGTDPFTSFLFQNNPVITAGICLVKTTLGGFLSGLVYRVFAEKKPLLAVFSAAMLLPVVNTGVFVLGCLTIVGTINAYIASVGMTDTSAIYFIFILCAGVNFILEFCVNAIVSPALKRVVDVVTKRLLRK